MVDYIIHLGDSIDSIARGLVGDPGRYPELVNANVGRVRVVNTPQGRVIRDSEEKARDALDRFRRVAYEKAIQMKVNAAEAAFPPSEQRHDGKEETA